jgi:alkylation response protein AidB-like acyl-CoA dehydrogenase
MSWNPIGQALSALNKVAGNELLQKLGLYGPATKIAYHATREGFRAATVVQRQWKSVAQLGRAERLPGKAPGELFDLSLTEEQTMIRDMTQRFASEVLRPAAAKADAERVAPADLASKFAELGLAQFAVPEALGGAAAETSTVTQVLVAEDLAYGDMGMAVALLSPIAVANALARWGSAAQQATYLAPFAGSEPPVATFAVAEARPAFDARELRTRARKTEQGGYVLSGEKMLVPLADTAELLLVAADLVGEGPQLFLVDPHADGVTVKADPGMGLRAASLGSVRFADVALPPAALMGEGPHAARYEEVLQRSSIAWSALAVGTAQAVLDYVIPYCNDRRAFGEPISHRQSVAFMIANIATELEGMRLLTWRAASRAEHGLTFQREAYLARVLCAEKGMQIGTDGVQLLGGHGFTKEHPVERWYRDLRAIAVMDGGVLV